MPILGGKRARLAVSGLLVLTLAGGMSACGGGGGDELTADISADSTHRYSPNELEVNLNEESTFTFRNKDKTVHNITVPGLSNDIQQNAVEVDVQPGERGSFKLPKIASAPRDGFFLFYCKYHQTEGMSGKIKISK